MALAHRGLSLSRISAHLAQRGVPVASSTLSYWQRGMRHPDAPRSLEAVRALEELLRLPVNALVVLIGPRTRPAPTDSAVVSFAEVAGSWAKTDELFASMEPRNANPTLAIVAVHDSGRVGPHRELRRCTTRVVVRPVVQGADRYFAVVRPDEVGDVADVVFQAVDGCRVGRIRRDPETRLVMVELLFDRHLGEGEVHVFSYRVSYPSCRPTEGIYRTFRLPCESYLLRLSFHRRALPVRCLRYVRETEDSPPLERDELVCWGGEVASAYFSDVGPGQAGVAVEWD
ncbi:hypothetical protein F0L68_01340 [Solihabitans fulvus]|uniref:XRE family transcriptional regulator n=2 Tax=Solihabitans fulvus TaxID=1892852 RepID=A0A5B2XV90_9PSEU|nr:hypothetical protein F0L68_01340 [Solihabitans fulvus]